MSFFFHRDDYFPRSDKQTRRALRCISFVIIILLTASSPARAGTDLTDEEKKTIVYAMYRDYQKKDFPDVPDIHPKQAMVLVRDGKVVFVDTRSQSEMNISMLPDSISQETFLNHPEKYRDKTVITYCTISYRSGKFAQEMKKQNVPVYNLAGGILAWVLEGGKIYNKTGETKQIHVYGENWDYPANGYESVQFGFFEKLFGS